MMEAGILGSQAAAGPGTSCHTLSGFLFSLTRTFGHASRDWRGGAWLPVPHFIDANDTTGVLEME